jgi:thiamine biosynthesis lipoprotein
MVKRRRLLQIVAASACCVVTGPASMGAAGEVVPTVWRGTALGAEASLTVRHHDDQAARRLVTRALDEIERLEKVFSLYRPDSALVALNENGYLDAPPLELVLLLDQSRLWSERTDGAFDVTVQPAWQHHDGGAGSMDFGSDGNGTIADLIDYRQIDIAPHLIRYGRKGMAVTLNGIAQGYISDRVAELFRDAGMTGVLVSLGELNALGMHPDGRPWQVGVKQETGVPGDVESVALTDQALATSSSRTTHVDRGPEPHIIDPHNGNWADELASASVVARRACDADALSTALMATGNADRLLSDLKAPDIEYARIVDRSGGSREYDLRTAV